jgi:threonylcarbamoyladenosine tRNA methylthiotransferase MtaB
MNIPYQVHTFGCKVNTYDSGLIDKNIKAFGAKQDENLPKVHILNTCAVTQEATKEAVRTVRRLKARDPFCKVVITGCSAQVDTGAYENLPGVDLVVANSHKSFLPEILSQYFKGEIKEKIFKSNIFKKEDLEEGGGLEQHHTRSFLKIQDGCNSFCTYCIIPYARGKSRSIPMEVLVRRIQDLNAQGAGEIVLTGVHIGDYEDPNRKINNGLEDLIENILKKTKIPRIRLTSLEPPEVTDRLLDLYSDERMCPHFHMSIQSAQTQVLADMKRKYTQQEVRSSLLRIAKQVPNVFIGMDVIVGFPTESEVAFNETYQVLTDLPWSKIHVFPYSERVGTRAAQIEESVPVGVRKARSQKLRELSQKRYEEMAQLQIGSFKKVLLLKNSFSGNSVSTSVGENDAGVGAVLTTDIQANVVIEGLSRDYWPVKIKVSGDQASKLQTSKEVTVKIEAVDCEHQHDLIGSIF